MGAQPGHLVIAQHQPVLLVVDVQPGRHGVDCFAQAALCALGVVQGLFERALLVHRVGDVCAQHHHAAPVLQPLGDQHPAVTLDLLHLGVAGGPVAGHAVGQPGMGVLPCGHDMARSGSAAQHVFKAGAVVHRHGGARAHLPVLGIAQHQAVVGVVDCQAVGQDVERGAQLGGSPLRVLLRSFGRCKHRLQPEAEPPAQRSAGHQPQPGPYAGQAHGGVHALARQGPCQQPESTRAANSGHQPDQQLSAQGEWCGERGHALGSVRVVCGMWSGGWLKEKS